MKSINKLGLYSTVHQEMVYTDLNTIYQSNNRKFIKYNKLVYEQIDLVLSNYQNLTFGNETIDTQYGFVIAGYCPSYVDNITNDSIAFKCGLRKSDLIMKINNVNCCRATLKTILSLIKNSSAGNSTLRMTVFRLYNNNNNNMRRMICSENIKKKKTNKLSSNKDKDTAVQRSKKKLLSKLFKPSLWLSCAQPFNNILATSESDKQKNQQQHNDSTFYYVNNGTNPAESKLGEYISCERECCLNNNRDHSKIKENKSSSTTSVGDTGYETLSRYDTSSTTKTNDLKFKLSKMIENGENDNIDEDFTIATVTNTINSYSQCDLTIDSNENKVKRLSTVANQQEQSQTIEKFNEYKIELIGKLIEMEANFVTYLSLSVSTFSRPLRGFFINQQDYFTLFQNIEKILIISENFLLSMEKWSPVDFYTRIGQLYTQKLSLFRDAFAIYLKGYYKSISLLNDLKKNSKQIRFFLKEVETSQLKLSQMIVSPITHIKNTLSIFKEIRKYTPESRRNPTEAPHIDSIIFELKNLLQSLNDEDTKNICNFGMDYYDEYEMDTTSTTTFCMASSILSSINETSIFSTTTSKYEISSCCSSTSSTSTLPNIDDQTNFDTFYSLSSIKNY